MSAYAALQVVGYLIPLVPGAPGYDELEPGVWIVMDFLIFVTLALAAGLRHSEWVARIAGMGVTAAIVLSATRHGRAAAYVVLVALAGLLTVVALLIRPRAPAGRGEAAGSAAPAH